MNRSTNDPADAGESDEAVGSGEVRVARIVRRVQAGDQRAFTDLYLHYFDRVYGYMRIALKDPGEAEDATQEVFMKVLGALPNYEVGAVPFRSWLFTIARNCAISHLRKGGKVAVQDPDDVGRHQDRAQLRSPLRAEGDRKREELTALRWVSDRDLTLLIERLPLAQRQVVFLRFVLDFDAAEIGEILSRKPESVRQLQHRALRFLEERLDSAGRSPDSPRRRRPLAMRARYRRGALRPAHGFTPAGRA